MKAQERSLTAEQENVKIKKFFRQETSLPRWPPLAPRGTLQ